MNHLRKLIYPSIGQVHKLYPKYVAWSFVSNVAVSAQQVLATHSVLASVSTCDTDAVRTFNYIGKDLIGQAGGLLIIAKLGKTIDIAPNKFLGKANVLQQVSYLATSATPLLADYFLPIAGAANVLNNVSFIGFGAINAKCIQALSSDNNMGEIYAKVSIFNTLGSSIGMLVGLLITFAIPDHSYRMIAVPILGIIRVLSFNQAIKGILEK
jgi:hypothetical protein